MFDNIVRTEVHLSQVTTSVEPVFAGIEPCIILNYDSNFVLSNNAANLLV